MSIKNKKGIVLITCDRNPFYEKAIASLKDIEGIYKVVVDDGTIPVNQYVDTIKTSGKEGVAKAKNHGVSRLLDAGCEYIFLMEDDIEITNSNVFDHYIQTSEYTGIKHLNYGLHGNHNLNQYTKEPERRLILNYGNTKVDFFGNCLGAFSFYTKEVFETIGLFDIGYYNALEHVKHTYDAYKAGFTTPFRWFADAHKAENYLKDIVPDHQQSKIRNDSDFQQVFKKGLDRFIKQTGFSVVRGYGPEEPIITEEECIKVAKRFMEKNK